MHVLAYEADLHLPDSRSLKAKRAIVKSLLDGARHRFGVAASEVGFQDQWQRTRLGFAAVSGKASHAEDVISEVDRFIWSHPEVQVLSTERRWLE
ncbi:MAG TPA: DUF503 domain-containing protein [Acidimicrobiales bacterium]